MKPVFNEAVTDLSSLGINVENSSSPGTQGYAVISGRSNARWWLIPLDSGRVTVSGLALFQPLLITARILKYSSCVLSLLGMNFLMTRRKIYLGGESSLGVYFPGLAQPIYAYFTGTDSPHRKVAVQVMDTKGRIKGFAKLSCNPKVRILLEHETEILQQVNSLQLKTAHIPQVLYSGVQGEGYCLLTDTKKTSLTRSVTTFGAVHRDFLRELANVTNQLPISAADLAIAFGCRVECLKGRVDQAWMERLQRAVRTLAEEGGLLIPQCLSHGDFTPWNTFISNGRLYVFDWEYAEEVASPGNDIIHFVLNQPRLRGKTTEQKVSRALDLLVEPWTGLDRKLAPSLLFIYLLTQVLLQVERFPDGEGQLKAWDGAEEQATMLDELQAVMAGLLV